jgi:hypothetical protein
MDSFFPDGRRFVAEPSSHDGFYNPFEGDYDEGRTFSFMNERRSLNDFVALLERLQVRERIVNYHARGYDNNQDAGAALPADISRLILVCQRIFRAVWMDEEKIGAFLSLVPPILQEENIEEMQYMLIANNKSYLLHFLIRFYAAGEWIPFITTHVHFRIGIQGDTELLDKFLEKNVQPKIEMMQGAILGAKVDIIDRLFTIHNNGLVRALEADNDNMEKSSLFVYAIDAVDSDGSSKYEAQVMDRLIMFGTNPNGNGTLPLPLEEAFYTGNENAIELLLSYGANPNIVMQKYNLPLLSYAVKAQAPLSVIKLLTQYGADFNLVYNGKTALSFAVDGDVRRYLLSVTDLALHVEAVAPVVRPVPAVPVVREENGHLNGYVDGHLNGRADD